MAGSFTDKLVDQIMFFGERQVVIRTAKSEHREGVVTTIEYLDDPPPDSGKPAKGAVEESVNLRNLTKPAAS